MTVISNKSSAYLFLTKLVQQLLMEKLVLVSEGLVLVVEGPVLVVEGLVVVVEGLVVAWVRLGLVAVKIVEQLVFSLVLMLNTIICNK